MTINNFAYYILQTGTYDSIFIYGEQLCYPVGCSQLLDAGKFIR